MIDEFIKQHTGEDVGRLALQRNRYSWMSDTDFRFALQQIEGRQRMQRKLPFLQQYADWWYAPHLSLEQCSSEATACYKAGLVRGSRLVDLTGGMGIDTLFLSRSFQQAHYVEHKEDLCRLAQHNFKVAEASIEVHHAEAEQYLQTMPPTDVVYIDPARRSAAGKKVFRIEDCEPDLSLLLPLLQNKCQTLLLKLSPMIDLTQVLRQLPYAKEVHVVAVKNEVKEVLVLCRFDEQTPVEEMRIHAVNLQTNKPPLVFTLREEQTAVPLYATALGTYLYEPNAAILKAGAFCIAGERYGLEKLDSSTHLYTSSVLQPDFPGRIFRIVGGAEKKQLKGRALNILSRNFPLSADGLRQQLKIKEGDTEWLIATRMNKTPMLLLAEQIG